MKVLDLIGVLHPILVLSNMNSMGKALPLEGLLQSPSKANKGLPLCM